LILNAVIRVLNCLIVIGNFLWGKPMIIFLCIVAIIYTIGVKGFQFSYLRHIFRNTFGKKLFGVKTSNKGISSFKALCMALSNTLGVGNIAGVAMAIALGGPGAVLWIWIAALLALVIKYAEITLGVKYREIDPNTGVYRGGFMFYVKNGLGKKWTWIAIAYAGLNTVAYINAPGVQINTIASSVTTYLDVPPLAIGIVCAILLGIVLIGGVNRVSSFAEKVVPAMTIAYCVMTLIVLVLNITAIPHAFAIIFKYAITDAKAIAGGFGGATVALALRYGLARGFYSNGAGTGDSPMAHASADVDHPCKQGIWGISEVIVDVIVCTCTALVILVTGVWQTGKSGAALTASAFATAFHSEALGNILIMIIIIFFAFTTAVVCAYYGETCLKYFTLNSKIITFYRLLICVAVAFDTNPIFVDKLNILWGVGDFNVAIAIMLNLIVLVVLRKEVFASTEEYKELVSGRVKEYM